MATFDVTVDSGGTAVLDFGTFKVTLTDDERYDLQRALASPSAETVTHRTGPFGGVASEDGA